MIVFGTAHVTFKKKVLSFEWGAVRARVPQSLSYALNEMYILIQIKAYRNLIL